MSNNQKMVDGAGRRSMDSVALACLFLRGLTPSLAAPRGCWPLVWQEFRRVPGDRKSQVDVLRAKNLPEVASLLMDDVRYEAALRAVEQSRVLSVADATYPLRWLHALGAQAPPVLWRRGGMPSAPCLSLVGSRDLGAGWRQFASDVGAAVVGQGRTLVSGGAVGADRYAADAAIGCGLDAPVVEILPFGLDRAQARPGVCLLSVSPPWADFTTGQAMERNALIYAASSHTVVVRPRFKVGGTWTGAVDATRRRLSTLLVAGPAGDRAVASLIALGATRLGAVSDLGEALLTEAPPLQPGLFGSSVVREAHLAFA